MDEELIVWMKNHLTMEEAIELTTAVVTYQCRKMDIPTLREKLTKMEKANKDIYFLLDDPSSAGSYYLWASSNVTRDVANVPI